MEMHAAAKPTVALCLLACCIKFASLMHCIHPFVAAEPWAHWYLLAGVRINGCALSIPCVVVVVFCCQCLLFCARGWGLLAYCIFIPSSLFCFTLHSLDSTFLS